MKGSLMELSDDLDEDYLRNMIDQTKKVLQDVGYAEKRMQRMGDSFDHQGTPSTPQIFLEEIQSAFETITLYEKELQSIFLIADRLFVRNSELQAKTEKQQFEIQDFSKQILISESKCQSLEVPFQN